VDSGPSGLTVNGRVASSAEIHHTRDQLPSRHHETPRLAVASPHFSKGWVHWAFGSEKTVLRERVVSETGEPRCRQSVARICSVLHHHSPYERLHSLGGAVEPSLCRADHNKDTFVLRSCDGVALGALRGLTTSLRAPARSGLRSPARNRLLPRSMNQQLAPLRRADQKGEGLTIGLQWTRRQRA
jgi:hypothetical protein